MDQFYLQDSRSFVGNDMVFWVKDGNGYTTDVSKAHVYSRNEALDMHQARNSDIPWPKAYIDAATRPAVDFQYTDIACALRGMDIVLSKPEKKKRETLRCFSCKSFVSQVDYWNGKCPRCGADSRP